MYKIVFKSPSLFAALVVLILLLLPVTASANVYHNHGVPHWKSKDLTVTPSASTYLYNSGNTYPSNGMIHWKEQDWFLSGGRADPGNNYWNNTGAWIDNQNRLHLTIINKCGKWYCTELVSQHKYTYGTFTWTVASPVYTFDKNSVLGLFTYQDDNHELDIEPARWGYENGDNLGYSVQPYQNKGNSQTYKVKGTSGANTTYKLEWKPNYIKFSSMQNGKVISEWNYTQASGIPKTPETVMMNLWLFKPPSDGKNIECIISDFNITN
jgi:endo-1,3-1,4-beta-glycanase ExoK